MIYKNGNVKITPPPHKVTNLYKEQYWNATSAMNIHYDYETDIFKDYGFDTCIALEPTREDDDQQTWSYSYFSYTETLKKDATYVYTMWYYNDSNGPFEVHAEKTGGITMTNNPTGFDWYTHSGLKNKVYRLWLKVKNISNGAVMLYPSPGTLHQFRTNGGMQYVAGITIYESWDPTGTSDIILPMGSKVESQQIGGFIESPEINGIYNDRIILNNYIEI